MASFLNVTQITQNIITAISQVPGAGTQKYAEPQIALMLKQAFYYVVDEEWWPHLMKWFGPLTLDGTTGVITTDLTRVADYESIRYVYLNDLQRPVPQLSPEVNPFTLLGSAARFIEPLHPDDDPGVRLFRIWPLDTVVPVYVHAQVLPTNLFTDTSVLVPFDNVYLEHAVAERYFKEDGANPSAMANFEKLRMDRYEQLYSRLNAQPLLLDNRGASDYTQWREEPY